jgi:hypothetical protein
MKSFPMEYIENKTFDEVKVCHNNNDGEESAQIVGYG